jgi:hypothetical protein
VRKSLKLVADAVGEARCNALVDDFDTMRQDGEGVVERDLSAVSFRQGRNTLPLRQITHDERVVGRQSVDRKRRSGHREEPVRGRNRFRMRQAVRPEDQSHAIDGAGPPWRTSRLWHRPNEAQNLAGVEDGLFDVGDAALVNPHQLLVAAVETLLPRKTFDLWEVGDGVQADKMEHGQVGLHHRAHGIRLHVPVGKVVPTLQQRLNLFEPAPRRCCRYGPSPLPASHGVREAAEKLAALVHKPLQWVEEKAQVQWRQLDTLGHNLVIQEVTEKMTKGKRASTEANGRVTAREFMDLVEDSGPLCGTLRLPQPIRVWHGRAELCDGEQRCRVAEQRQVLVDHHPRVDQPAAIR